MSLKIDIKEKKIGDKHILSTIQVKIKAGICTVMIGKSGAGKTTLLKCIHGLEDIDQGAVSWKNEVIKGPADQLVPGFHLFRFVRQDFDLAHNTTVYLNVKQTLRGYRDDYKEERTKEILGICRLEHLEKQKVETLSGGEKQRLAIARALAPEPDVLILDEPFSNLDPINKRILKDVIVDLKKSKITLIIALHEPQDVLELADDIVVIHDGGLYQHAHLEELWTQRKDLLIGNLLGEINPYESGNIKFFRPADLALSSDPVSKPLAKGKIIKSYPFGDSFRIKIKDAKGRIWLVHSQLPQPIGESRYIYSTENSNTKLSKN